MIRKHYGHTSRVNAVTYNKDNSVIVSGGYDCKVFLWDCKSYNKEPIQVLDHSKDSISNVKIVDKSIFVSSIDGRIRTYDIRYGELTTDNFF